MAGSIQTAHTSWLMAIAHIQSAQMSWKLLLQKYGMHLTVLILWRMVIAHTRYKMKPQEIEFNLDGQVKVDSVVEKRKSAKLTTGQTVVFKNHSVKII